MNTDNETKPDNINNVEPATALPEPVENDIREESSNTDDVNGAETSETPVSTLPESMVADISDQFSKLISSEASTTDNNDSGVESSEKTESIESASSENPPFLRPELLTIPEKKLPDHLVKAINFRKTLKHKRPSDYEQLSRSEKAVTKNKIIHHLIHVLRTSTQKNIFESHKKSITKLRHTLNKHLDYIEKNRKSIKKRNKKE
jgi:hypothetical protein